ncbi:hypothetical protein ACRTDU_19660 [Sunxiuqinia elliptica]|uniref:Uncharacterized protein n=1 Tax=Sunxiuqinia elliptica TaxID=655355 RepID=A0A1I2D0C5_9BACT|nr:hypothetical protein [Sunxiuqinia elliptica]SFE73971.1 hypothetical protein SAMN05216283_101890 [Sunxiuqinia elliptica]
MVKQKWTEYDLLHILVGTAYSMVFDGFKSFADGQLMNMMVEKEEVNIPCCFVE